MIKINYQGRLGNNLVQYSAASVLAKKHGLKLEKPKPLEYPNKGILRTSFSSDENVYIDFGDRLSIKPIDGIEHEENILLTDKNYFKHLDGPVINVDYTLNGYFEDSKLLCQYRNEILKLYKLPDIDFKPSMDDAFISCRLGDFLYKKDITKNRPPYFSISYLEKHLKSFRNQFDKVFITSDTINYPPLQELIKKYNLTIYQNDPLETILFGCRFNHLILSTGLFSYWMAYLSNAKDIMVYKHPIPHALYNPNQEIWNYNPNVKFSS